MNEHRRQFSKEVASLYLGRSLGVKEPAGREIVGSGAAISGGSGCIRGVTCVACAPAGLGRCTRMHKGPRPRSMSETGHLPTDVESSDRDPGAAFLLPAGIRFLSLSILLSLSPSLPLFSSTYLTLSSPFLFVPSCFWRNLPILCIGNLCPPLFALCESHPVFSTCLWRTSFGLCFLSSAKKQCVFHERRPSNTNVFKVFNREFWYYVFSFFESFFLKSRRNISRRKL